jgi:hypothetical protein
MIRRYLLGLVLMGSAQAGTITFHGAIVAPTGAHAEAIHRSTVVRRAVAPHDAPLLAYALRRGPVVLVTVTYR